MDEPTLLAGVLSKTGTLIAGVRDDQWSLPTPCPDYDVRALVNHMLGWVQVFDAGCHHRAFDGDPTAYRFGPDPAAEFRSAAGSLVDGWTEFGLDRPVRIMSGEMPGESVFNITVMEYLTHGWDLAKATSQATDLNPGLAEGLLAGARQAIQPAFRGPDGKSPFGPEQQAPAGASNADRLAAFLGRTV